MKHLPFESIYRSDYEIVEERRGNTRLYPHTEQLPVILRAIRNEFYTGLPPRIARADHRANGFDKLVLRESAVFFCTALNGARKDQLRLAPVFDEHLISKPAIIQQITEETPRGLTHHFKLYAGENNFFENFLCGRRAVFADHVLQRFSARTENYVGEDLTMLHASFFDNAMIAMPVGPDRAFVVSYFDSILAFPYKVQDDEYFITTCLTINEIHSMELEVPPHTINVHYERPFVRPVRRNWIPTTWMEQYYHAWERKVKPNLPKPNGKRDFVFNWHYAASKVRDILKKRGHGPGTNIVFQDNIHGPMCLDLFPGKTTREYDELEVYKTVEPEHNWDAIFDAREHQGTLAPIVYPPLF